MEFDVRTLSPTYRVIEGLPGRSNAFVIAERLGLPTERIDRARSFLSRGEIRAEDILDELERERQAMQRHREAAERDRAEARRAREDYERRLAAFEREKESALSDRFRAFDRFLRDGQRRIEGVLAEAHVGTSEDARGRLHEIMALREESDRLQAEAADLVRRETVPSDSLEIGRVVRVRSLAADGRIVQLGPKDKVTVDLDGVRVTTEAGDLAPPRGDDGSSSPRTRSRPRVRRVRPEQVPLQINVRGMTVSEALREIEAYLDRLLLADVRRASVLHGKGTGALREAVHAYLASCSFIASFGHAPPNLGGEGVTEFVMSGDESVD
jgi:DNA mismatch repair protein MutS2